MFWYVRSVIINGCRRRDIFKETSFRCHSCNHNFRRRRGSRRSLAGGGFLFSSRWILVFRSNPDAHKMYKKARCTLQTTAPPATAMYFSWTLGTEMGFAGATSSVPHAQPTQKEHNKRVRIYPCVSCVFMLRLGKKENASSGSHPQFLVQVILCTPMPGENATHPSSALFSFPGGATFVSLTFRSGTPVHNPHAFFFPSSLCCAVVQVAELSGLPGKTRELEEELASTKVRLAAAEEGLRQAEVRVKDADRRAQVT